MTKVSQIHALMAVFEKTLIDREDIEKLKKSGMTLNMFLAKIARKIILNIDDLIGPDHLISEMMK